MNKKIWKKIIIFAVTAFLLLGMICVSVNTGSIAISPGELVKGIFIEYSQDVASIYDLRFPRIVISILAGAGLSVSGVLLQSVFKNPLTDPGIIGVSGGAQLATVLATACVPQIYSGLPFVAIAGGLLSFGLIYSLSMRTGGSPMRLILIGVALSTLYDGISQAIDSMSGSNQSSVSSIVNGTITMKTWSDVTIALHFIPVCLVLALCVGRRCNIMALDDKTAQGIGVNVARSRFIIACIAVCLASVATAVAGVVSFVGLIVPHMARMCMGNEHRVLIPYSCVLGALVFLAADTVGRTICYPYEISASVIMAICGGICFILLLQRRGSYGN